MLEVEGSGSGERVELDAARVGLEPRAPAVSVRGELERRGVSRASGAVYLCARGCVFPVDTFPPFGCIVISTGQTAPAIEGYDMSKTTAPAVIITEGMRRRHYAALAAVEAGYAMRTAPAREHAGMTAAARRAALTMAARVRMTLSNR